MPEADYHADPCVTPSLSSSLAETIIAESPAHARLKHPRLRPPEAGGVEETAAMGFGSVVHEMLLHRGGGFAVFPGETWRGNEAKAFREQAKADGKTPIKTADHARATACADAARAQLAEMGLAYVLTEGESEATAIWQAHKQWMRARFDRWIPGRNEIWDIKTSGKPIHPDNIGRIITAQNYDLRSEFYLMGAEALTGLPARKGGLGYQFIFIETEPPFCVVPGWIDAAGKTRGRMRAEKAVETWAACMESGRWPGYVNGPVEFASPGWVDFEIEETEIKTCDGARIV